LILGLTVGFILPASAQVFSADAVKAAFLHRFASYVEWPPEAVTDAPFVIGVVGGAGVARNLDELLPNITVQNHPATVRRLSRASELDGVHILFIAAEAQGRTRELRAAALRLPILVVTETADGLMEGSVINFLESNSRVRFEVSLTAANRAGLRIYSSLLSVAARVEQPPQARLSSIDHVQSRNREAL
jgi:hypothetical protein